MARHSISRLPRLDVVSDLVGTRRIHKHRLIAKSTVLFVSFLLLACNPDSTETEKNETGTKPLSEVRLSVSLTPQELTTFRQNLALSLSPYPGWKVELELIPQQGVGEKINAQVAAGNLSDVSRLPGLQAHRWIRRGAFLELTEYLERSEMELDDFDDGPTEQFRWKNRWFGLIGNAPLE